MLSFSDTIANINLNMLNLDTLLSGAAMVDTLKEASVTLALTFTNDIPFQIRGVFTCLDENGKVVIDPQTDKPLRITKGDTVLIPAPTFTFNEMAMNWMPEPTKHMEIIQVEKEDLETLRQVKSIEFLAQLDDESLSEVFKQGNFTTKLTPKEGLRIKLAIGADLEAILKLGNEQ